MGDVILDISLKGRHDEKMHIAMVVLLALTAYHVNARCHWKVHTDSSGLISVAHDNLDIQFVVNNASDKWMYLWMGHPNHGEDNGNLNLKPHSSATAIGCSNGAGYAVTGIIVTQGKDVLYTFDVLKQVRVDGWVKKHTWKGGCYVAWSGSYYLYSDGVVSTMSKMASQNFWGTGSARVRIDCV